LVFTLLLLFRIIITPASVAHLGVQLISILYYGNEGNLDSINDSVRPRVDTIYIGYP